MGPTNPRRPNARIRQLGYIKSLLARARLSTPGGGTCRYPLRATPPPSETYFFATDSRCHGRERRSATAARVQRIEFGFDCYRRGCSSRDGNRAREVSCTTAVLDDCSIAAAIHTR